MLYTDNIKKPVLAIEVDGKHHSEQKQKDRDKKKETILKDMEIPLLRIPSKVVWEVAEFEKRVKEKINKVI